MAEHVAWIDGVEVQGRTRKGRGLGTDSASEASVRTHVAPYWLGCTYVVHCLGVALWIPPRRNTPYRPHGPRIMCTIHAIKWRFISIIYRINGFIRCDRGMLLGYQGKHADSAGLPIPEVVRSTCFQRSLWNLNSIFYAIPDSCVDWRSFCCVW